MSKYLWLGRVILSLALLLPIPGWARHILAITPVSPFPAEVIASTTTTAVYMVTNTASSISVTPVNQTQYPDGVTLLIASSTCGSLLGPGQSCSIELQLRAPSTPQTISFALRQRASPSADGVQLPISIQIMPSTGGISIAAGLLEFPGDVFAPLLASSSDRAASFKNVALPSSIASSALLASSCSGSGGGAICAVTGDTFPGSNPFMLVSLNAGSSWERKLISGALNQTSLIGVSCVGESSNAYCVAVGGSLAINESAIAVSTDGGVSWARVIPAVPVSHVTYGDVSCVGNGSSPVCVVTGEDSTSSPTFHAVLDVSNDRGLTWTSKSAPLVAANGGALKSVSCTGATCVAAGNQAVGDGPFIAVSSDGANTWQAITSIAGFSGKVDLLSVSCTEDVVSPMCVTVGEDTTNILHLPFLAVSQNGGVDWTYQPIEGPGTFKSVSCIGTGTDAICAVVGETSVGFNPVIVMGTNRGTVWTKKLAVVSQVGPELNAVSCKGSNASAVCVAVGHSKLSGPQPHFPLIVASNDGGAIWTEKQVAGLDPSIEGQLITSSIALGDGGSSSANRGDSSSQRLSVVYPQKAFGLKNILNLNINYGF